MIKLMFDFFEKIEEAISVNKLYPHFLKIMGMRYAFKSSNIDTMHSFKNMIKAISKEENKIKKFKRTESKIFLNLMKAKIALFFNNKEESIRYVAEAKKYLLSNDEINKERNLMDSEDTLLYLKDLLEIEIENISWVNKVESKLYLIDSSISNNQSRIEDIINSYSTMEINSPEHLLKTKEHLELVVKNSLLSDDKRIDNFQDLNDEGKFLVSKIKLMKSKLISLEYITLLNDQPLLIKENLDNYLIYRKLTVEEIKLKFYLNISKEEIFKDIALFLRSEILFNTEKPLDILFNDFIPMEIKNESSYNNHHNFYNFLKTLRISFNRKEKMLNIQLLSEAVEKETDRIFIS